MGAKIRTAVFGDRTPGNGSLIGQSPGQSRLALSVIIPTRDRPAALRRALASLAKQEVLPAEVIVVDASTDFASKEVVGGFARSAGAYGCAVRWEAAAIAGAAMQRNQALLLSSQSAIAFCDDDIVLESGCLHRLWEGLQSDERLGGVNAMIVNQSYCSPGLASRVLFAVLAGRRMASYAGRVIGPAVNLLPENREELPDVVPVDWLNTTCTIYRREALPNPAFLPHFTGYSLMEDLALSLTVGRSWKLANVRTARIFHDSQPGVHKEDAAALNHMELVNRHYITAEVLHMRGAGTLLKLTIWEVFQLAVSALQQRLRRPFWQMLRGKWSGACEVYRIRRAWRCRR